MSDNRFLVQLTVLDTLEEDEMDEPRVIHNFSKQVSSKSINMNSISIGVDIATLIQRYLAKLNEKSGEDMGVKFNTKNSKNPVLVAVSQLEVGEGLLVDFSEWALKTPLPEYIYQYGRAGRNNALVGKAFSSKKTDTGWQIVRDDRQRGED